MKGARTSIHSTMTTVLPTATTAGPELHHWQFEDLRDFLQTNRLIIEEVYHLLLGCSHKTNALWQQGVQIMNN